MVKEARTLRFWIQRMCVTTGVHLVAPDAGEDVVELDVDGGEGQEAGHEHLRERPPVPGQRRNLTRVLGRPYRCIELRLRTFAGVSSPQTNCTVDKNATR